MMQKFCKAVTMAAALAVGGMAQADSVEGVLEKGRTYSAIFEVSEESGDVIGYPFKNQSAVGKSIFENCLPQMVCRVGKAQLNDFEDIAKLDFPNDASGWVEITKASDIGMETFVFGYAKSMKTRYGVLSVREDDNELLFKGKPLKPSVQGNSSLHIVADYEIGKDDVFLVQNTGGTACPALFHIVKVNASGAQVSKEFGTCSDIIYPRFEENKGLTIFMQGFSGPLEDEANQKKSAMTKYVYQWSIDGKLKENGQLVQ